MSLSVLKIPIIFLPKNKPDQSKNLFLEKQNEPIKILFLEKQNGPIQHTTTDQSNRVILSNCL